MVDLCERMSRMIVTELGKFLLPAVDVTMVVGRHQLQSFEGGMGIEQCVGTDTNKPSHYFSCESVAHAIMCSLIVMINHCDWLTYLHVTIKKCARSCVLRYLVSSLKHLLVKCFGYIQRLFAMIDLYHLGF